MRANPERFVLAGGILSRIGAMIRAMKFCTITNRTAHPGRGRGPGRSRFQNVKTNQTTTPVIHEAIRNHSLLSTAVPIDIDVPNKKTF